MKIALTLLLFALSTLPAFAAPVPFFDLDQDGTFTPGDVPIVLAPDSHGCLRIVTDLDVVLPKGSVPAIRWACVYIHTTGKLTLGANLLTKMLPEVVIEPRTTLHTIWAKGVAGMRTGPNVTLEAGGWIYVGSTSGRLFGGPANRYTSKFHYVDFRADLIEGYERLILRACNRAGFDSRSAINLYPGLNVIVACDGEALFSADESIHIDDAAQIQANSVFLFVLPPGGPLTLTNSTIKAKGAFSQATIYDYKLAPGIVPQGPVDIRGTSWQVEPFIIGEPVLR